MHNQAQGLPVNSLRAGGAGGPQQAQQNQFSMDVDAATGKHGPLTPDKGNMQQPMIKPAGTKQQKSVNSVNNQAVGQVANQLDQALKIQKDNQDAMDAMTGSKSVKPADLAAATGTPAHQSFDLNNVAGHQAPHNMMNEMTKLAGE